MIDNMREDCIIEIFDYPVRRKGEINGQKID